jgi:LysM repeat protein
MPAPAPAKTYIVKKGDSLYKIAKAEKVTVEQIAKANNLSKTSKIQIDQKLVIPTAIVKADTTSAPLPSVGTPSPASPVAAGNTYEVKSGDSLWKIAKNNNTTVAALKQANNLTKDSLKVGQKLVMPVKTAAATTVTTAALTTDPAQPTYIVGANDTILSIAQKHGVKVEDLMRVNKLTTSTRLQAGTKLVIPQAPSGPSGASPAVIAPSLIAN